MRSNTIKVKLDLKEIDIWDINVLYLYLLVYIVVYTALGVFSLKHLFSVLLFSNMPFLYMTRLR